MRTNDQYFQPGDKVMRVGGNIPGIRVASAAETGITFSPQFGQVYCVEGFHEGPRANVVIFVGSGGWYFQPGNPNPSGWPACAFRRVEEIKLCLEAVAKGKAVKEAQPKILNT